MSAGTLLDVLALGEALPQVTEEVGLLRNVAFAEQRSNGPGGLLGVVEGNTTVRC